MQSNGPVRKGGVSAEWTQELQAVEATDLAAAGVPHVSLPRRKVASASSIAPVGLDLSTRDLDQEVSASLVVRPPRRRRLGAIVGGAVAGCALILVAAGVARVGHASAEDSRAVAATAPSPQTTAPSSPAAPVIPVAASPQAATAPPASDGSTGTVRVEAPAKPGHVWLDGKKLSSPSALVSCGTHQVKVGRHKTHSIDVPCGGDIDVSK
jgi:hypothetical protein